MNHKLYIGIVAACFAALAVVFLALPRSTYSELEKRDLARFPALPDTLSSRSLSRYVAGISAWFSDTEPFRDQFMAGSMAVRRALKLNVDGEANITYHAAPATAAGDRPNIAREADVDGDELQEVGQVDGVAKVSDTGILIIGAEPRVRALMAYGGGAGGGVPYYKVLNRWAEAFRGTGVRLYCMVIPNATEYYCPTSASKLSNPQVLTIRNIYANLDTAVTRVNAHRALLRHRDEDIYLRTDHHWSPLGAYYAAQEFARDARVPFKPLSAYDRRTVRGFVGSMYGYSRDAAVKRSPEDFVYYVPRGLPYRTTYTDYDVDRGFNITREHEPHPGEFFQHFKDGSSAAYCTFLGTDKRLAHVHTGAASPRRLLVVKDSYGNALPGYLFYSFGEIHVVDFRYFNRDIRQYALDNGVTDILIANNIFNANSAATARRLSKLLKP